MPFQILFSHFCFLVLWVYWLNLLSILMVLKGCCCFLSHPLSTKLLPQVYLSPRETCNNWGIATLKKGSSVISVSKFLFLKLPNAIRRDRLAKTHMVISKSKQNLNSILFSCQHTGPLWNPQIFSFFPITWILQV